MIGSAQKVPALKHLFSLPVLVAALGYFVDIYDLLLFGIVRLPSLQALGLSQAAISAEGASILNFQMSGLLLGGILWGVLGDKKGRLSVLFGSILTYSMANLACGFVDDVTNYKLLRFIAGVGLAGELGAGITLVSETLPKELRALGTSLVAGIGLLGAVFAYVTVENFTWRNAYFVGGSLGIALLLLRVGVFESGLFTQIQTSNQVKKGNFFSFFTNVNRFKRYLRCIAIGLPTWYVIGILTTFSDEFGLAFALPDSIKPGLAIMWCYVGLSVGDLLSGVLSHRLHSRKKAVALLMGFTLLMCGIYLFTAHATSQSVYVVIGLMGLGIGYWAMFVTIGAEQFGTNLRATAAITIPNMVRGTVVGMTFLYGIAKPSWGVIAAGSVVGLLCFGLGFYAILTISESHDRDLDFLEE